MGPQTKQMSGSYLSSKSCHSVLETSLEDCPDMEGHDFSFNVVDSFTWDYDTAHFAIAGGHLSLFQVWTNWLSLNKDWAKEARLPKEPTLHN
jgi:hypothetical protein